MIHLNHLSIARCSGPDAGAFLHAQLSADIEALKPGASTFACYCNPKGQVIALLLIYREVGAEENSFLIGGSQALMEPTLKRLRMYVLHAQLAFDIDTGLTLLGASPSQSLGSLPPMGTTSFGHYVASETSHPRPENSAGSQRWLAEEITYGISWLDESTTQRFLPQMLGFDRIGAVSFSKGCYPGQEIVARARYLGTIKRRSLVLAVEGAPRLKTGSKLRVDAAGTQTNAIVIDQAFGTEGTSLIRLVTSLAAESPISEVEIDKQWFAASMLETP